MSMKKLCVAVAFTALASMPVPVLAHPAARATGGHAEAWAAAVAAAPDGGRTAEVSVRSPFTLADTRGEVPYGSGDLIAIKVEHRSSTVRLTARTKLGSNPARSATWRSPDTYIIWAIDVNADLRADFLAGIFNIDGEVVTEVVRNNSSYTHRCTPTFAHNDSAQFQMEFPRSCISSHPAIATYVTMQYDRYPATPSAPESVDYSPNTTWSPNVTQ